MVCGRFFLLRVLKIIGYFSSNPVICSRSEIQSFNLHNEKYRYNSNISSADVALLYLDVTKINLKIPNISYLNVILLKRMPCKTVKYVFYHNNNMIRIMRPRKSPIADLVVYYNKYQNKFLHNYDIPLNIFILI